MEEEDKKLKAKEILLSRLKQLEVKSSKNQPEQPQSSMPVHQPRLQSSKMEHQKGTMRVDTQEDFKKMPYQGKAKYDNELKALSALKAENPEVSQKPKKMFFEHYDTSEPYCPNIPNNNNPSGRPPNIPPEMYEGIVVKPKRPWVYLGTENLPPVQYQQINDKNFRQIQRKHFEQKKEEGKKTDPKKKKQKKNKEEENSDEFQSNFEEMEDQIQMSGESMLISDYKSQSKQSRQSKSKSKGRSRGKQSSGFPYDDEMSEGIQTKKNMGKMFEDMDNSEFDSDEEEEHPPRKKKPRKGKGMDSD